MIAILTKNTEIALELIKSNKLIIDQENPFKYSIKSLKEKYNYLIEFSLIK